MMQFPQKSEGKELKILVQPETQHRARYLTEGSRGSVKDCTQQSFPTVKVTATPWHRRLSLSKQESKSDCAINLQVPCQPSSRGLKRLFPTLHSWRGWMSRWSCRCLLPMMQGAWSLMDFTKLAGSPAATLRPAKRWTSMAQQSSRCPWSPALTWHWRMFIFWHYI